MQSEFITDLQYTRRFKIRYVCEAEGNLGECRLRMCASKLPFCLHLWGQNGHLNMASFPHSKRRCLERVCSHLYPFPQVGHVNGFSSFRLRLLRLPPPVLANPPPPFPGRKGGGVHIGRRWRSSKRCSLWACWINWAKTLNNQMQNNRNKSYTI